MEMKILAPAGDFESLKMAIYNGADEVYLGVKDFNARNNIVGFDMQTLKEAVEFAHLFNVKVHLTVNILFKNEELQSALDLIVEAYNLGVDAFIIQDLGLASLVNKYYPEVQMHASTQMGLHNLEGVQFVKKFGFKRVVLARETSLQEIKRIKDNCDIEIEYFAQGALCVSFSGNCYMSSYLFDASGNRGKCKQLCRLPYTFYKGDEQIANGFLLSAKDFCMIDRLQELSNAGVCSIKIEGRARRPYYVGATVKEYYNAVNGIKYDKENLLLAFNRLYTPGYFNGNADIISKYNNHIGIRVGKITKVVNGKNFNQVYFSSNRVLNKKSTFKIFNEDKEVATLTAYDLNLISAGQYMLTTTQKLKAGDFVNLIIDYNKEQEVLNTTKKVLLNINVTAHQNKKIQAQIGVYNRVIIVEGDECLPAQNSALTHVEIVDNFAKSDVFNCSVTSDLENVFLPKSKLNAFRRKVFEEVKNALTATPNKKLNKIAINTNVNYVNFTNFTIIENANQLSSYVNVIYSPEIYLTSDVEKCKQICEAQGKNFYLDLPNFATEQDIKMLKEIVNKTKCNIVANNYYALTFNANKIIAGFGLNVYNNVTANVLNMPVTYAEQNNQSTYKAPYMTLRFCPFKQFMNSTCAKCKYTSNCYLKMQNGKELKLKRKKVNSCTFYLY